MKTITIPTIVSAETDEKTFRKAAQHLFPAYAPKFAIGEIVYVERGPLNLRVPAVVTGITPTVSGWDYHYVAPRFDGVMEQATGNEKKIKPWE